MFWIVLLMLISAIAILLVIAHFNYRRRQQRFRENREKIMSKSFHHDAFYTGYGPNSKKE